MMWLTKEELAGALAHRLDMDHERANDSAEALLEVFGYHTEVIDNALSPEDRQVFYAMQLEGLLTIRNEETELYNGQTWRTNTWVMRVDRIRESALQATHAQRDLDPEAASSVYDGIPDEVWARHAASG